MVIRAQNHLRDWRRLPSDHLLALLNDYLASRIPGAWLKSQALPLAPQLSLYLINDDYPRNGLEPAQVEALMDNPPYWGFCWGSGQALARWLLDNPKAVTGKTVVDFGAGSGVAGIAAAMAGAAQVILCDQDELALAASRLNTHLNGIQPDFSTSLEATLRELDAKGQRHERLVLVADVFYDRDNLPLLPLLLENFDTVVVADSRLKGQPLPGMAIFGTVASHTVPDLDESVEFNRITLYHSTARHAINPVSVEANQTA